MSERPGNSGSSKQKPKACLKTRVLFFLPTAWGWKAFPLSQRWCGTHINEGRVRPCLCQQVYFSRSLEGQKEPYNPETQWGANSKSPRIMGEEGCTHPALSDHKRASPESCHSGLWLSLHCWFIWGSLPGHKSYVSSESGPILYIHREKSEEWIPCLFQSGPLLPPKLR